MDIRQTRGPLTIYPATDERPIIVDQFGFLLDGHHRYNSHLIYGTPLHVECWEMSDVVLLSVERLECTKEYTCLESKYVNENIEDAVNKGNIRFIDYPIIVEKANGVYSVRIGNWRAHYWMQHGHDFIRARIRVR